MANKPGLDYWYDGQIRRYLAQIIRVFSHFEVREVVDGGYNYNRVPCRYADPSRQVALIMQKGSENVLATVPMITVGIQTLQYNQARAADPMFSRTDQIAERKIDPTTGNYTSEQGNLYSIDRYMPVPFDLTVQVDVFTNNTDVKMQILEQLFVLFNPSLELISNSNPIDWSNVFEISIGDINWTTRTLPQGTEEQPIDIATITFNVPIWISPPAKVRRQKIIHSILADVHTVNSLIDLGYTNEYADFFGAIEDKAAVTVTPGDYRLAVDGDSAQLINPQGSPENWAPLLEQYGILRAGSILQLNLTNDPSDVDSVVVGSVALDPSDDTKLMFNLDSDTLPANTLTSVDAFIDPRDVAPGAGLPTPATGQRYLILEDIGASSVWAVSAVSGDILEYNGSAWVVSFDSDNTNTINYLVNDTTGDQWKWTGSQWISSWQGTYNPGYFRLVI